MTTERDGRILGALCGVAAAVLFGVTVPLAKLLLPRSSPVVLAGLLYVGAGVTLMVVTIVRRVLGRAPAGREAPLRPEDALSVLTIVVSGGIMGPILMLFGLQRLSGVTTALLLNLEAPFTIVLAVVAFGEHLGKRETAAAGLIIVGAASLGLNPMAVRFDAIGVLALIGACLSWAVDNNLTQQLSLRDPVALVRLKALGAGFGTLAIAATLGHTMPGGETIAAVMLIGGAGYGLSIVLDAYALRWIGAAREAAYFATAPFIGALAAVPLLGERIGPVDLAAAAVMATGVALLLRERHGHVHEHEGLEHEHLHVHDAHHPHEHSELVVEPHAHLHQHAPLRHDHPHVSDLHHRHRHR